MKKLLFFGLFFFLVTNCFSKEIKGVNLPEKIEVKKQMLLLNGAGVRKKFFMSIYIGALYVPEKMTKAKDVINKDVPKRILMHFLYSKVGKEKIIDAFKDDFENNSKDILPDIKNELEKFYSFFDRDIVKGDEVKITYLPETGVCVAINQDLKGCIKNKLFMTAIFSVWFGDDPPSEGLKDAMLGK